MVVRWEPPAAVPEPASFAVWGSDVGIGALIRRRRRAAK